MADDPPAEHEHVQQFDQVEAWRFEQLQRAGFNYLDAAGLARAAHVDIHRAEKLLAAGCDPDTAQAILL